MPTGLKHLITCRCVLSQYKNRPAPPPHMFVVFSVIEDDGTFRVRFAQCNNCGIVHKVTEINRSTIITRESMMSLPTIDDVKASINPRLASILENNDVDLASWELAAFIIEQKQWGSFVVLTTDEEDGVRQGKYVRIISDSLFKVETFTREETTQ